MPINQPRNYTPIHLEFQETYTEEIHKQYKFCRFPLACLYQNQPVLHFHYQSALYSQVSNRDIQYRISAGNLKLLPTKQHRTQYVV